MKFRIPEKPPSDNAACGSGPGPESTLLSITYPRPQVWVIREAVAVILAVSTSHVDTLVRAGQAPRFTTRWTRDRSLLQHELDAFIYARMCARSPEGLPPLESRLELPHWQPEEAAPSPFVALRLVRTRDAAVLLDMSVPTVQRRVRDDRSFVKPVAVGIRTTRFVLHEVEALARRSEVEVLAGRNGSPPPDDSGPCVSPSDGPHDLRA